MLSFCLRRSFPLLADQPATHGFSSWDHNRLCPFYAMRTTSCAVSRRKRHYIVFGPGCQYGFWSFSASLFMKGPQRLATPYGKKSRRFLCVFVEGGEGIFSGKPVDFFAANDYDESYGELFISAIMRERSVPFSWTATLTVTRPGTGAPPLRPPVCCGCKPSRAVSGPSCRKGLMTA